MNYKKRNEKKSKTYQVDKMKWTARKIFWFWFKNMKNDCRIILIFKEIQKTITLWISSLFIIILEWICVKGIKNYLKTFLLILFWLEIRFNLYYSNYSYVDLCFDHVITFCVIYTMNRLAKFESSFLRIRLLNYFDEYYSEFQLSKSENSLHEIIYIQTIIVFYFMWFDF